MMAAAAVISAVGLCLSWWGFVSAGEECRRYGQVDFFHCGPVAGMAVIGDCVAALAALVMIAVTPVRASRWLPLLPQVALAAAAIAVVLSPLRLTELADMVSRAMAIAWGVVGLWLFRASNTAVLTFRSTLGAVLGVTLVAWALGQALGDERPFPIGGGVFALVYAAWALRLASRVLRSWQPPPQPRGVLSGTAIALGLVFLAGPFWIGSTFGVAVLGDPSERFTVVNQTGGPIDFYAEIRLRAYATRVAAGESKEISTLEHGAYAIGAADVNGALLFCRNIRQGDLRKMRYVISVVDDPASCR
jgi:hypothetical protein